MNKNELREYLIKKRKEILKKKELSKIISNYIINLDIYEKAKVIALYKSMKDEVDTTYLINESLKNKIVLLPRIIDDKMVFITISKNTKYIKSNYGVLEPCGDVFADNIDLIIVPGVSFDRKLNRLGFGMGYYDKYLMNQDSYKIGICFNEQMMDLIPTDELDIKMDMVVTENKVYK